MIKLTAPNGEEIDPKAIASMRQNDGDYAASAKTVLLIQGEHQAVKESIEEIDLLIAGG